VEDMLSLGLLCFGMIGLWGYARNKKFFARAIWRTYFIVTAALIPLAPLFSAKYQQLLNEHGLGAMAAAYALSTLLVLPALWGWYSYAFNRPHLWVPS
jgi:hypothetical protein